jgi:hypothetical protein
MSEVFLCQTGQLTPASRRELKRAGVVVVEVEDPSRCTFIRAAETVSSSDMLWAAMNALQSQASSGARDQREQFVMNLAALVSAAHEATVRRDRDA